MGVMPIGKLIFTMSLPMMLSMLVQALYNVVDSIFVASLNEDAFTAVSLAFSIQNVMIALGVGTGVGVSALVSRKLGERKFEEANHFASVGVRLSLITTVIFMIVTFAITNPYYAALTDSETIYRYGVDYTLVVGMASVGIFTLTMFEKLLQATGRTMLSMIMQMSGAVVNIVLDPILIFGLFGFPRLEVVGAAAATVIGQCVSAVIGFIFCLKFNPDVRLSFMKYKMKLWIIKDIYKIGIPSIILSSVGSIMVFGYNKLLMAYTSTAAAVFGAYFKLQSFIFMPVFGLNNAVTPVIAYNYGARDPVRIKKAYKVGCLAAICILCIGTILFEFFPEALLAMFSASDRMLEIGVPALRIIGIHYPLAGFCIMSSALFQSLGYAFIAMIQSIMRQIAVLLPAAYILSYLGGLEAIWWSFPIAEVLSGVFVVVMVRYIYKKIINPLGAQKDINKEVPSNV